ncbi:PIN-like domain-containing protein [Sphingobacterium siyangense]|uniref:PIN-like domain-containing protein n=1 Tax=Sphingobacterium siyangense TaxID=459529 RepID=UPI0019664A99|nr:PIN-like domain-containing protein [Sphingobacterium siyangense]QRY55895.1 hypothetical protein JVX97_17910 [Sphingobacterium siyangense]
MNIDNIKLYQLDKQKEERLWKTAIFVFDTCALTDFYYLPKKTREKMYTETFPHFEGRLWIPAHVEFEFLKNRESIIPKPFQEQYDELKKLISNITPSFAKDVKNRLLDISKKTIKADKHPHLEQNNISSILEKINAFETELKTFEQNIMLQIKDAETEILSVKGNDDVLNAINAHFSVGSGYSFDRIMEITKEGKHRYEYKIPPGYGDFYKKEKKGTQIFGDLIIWKQILDKAKQSEKPIVFITNDITKDEDWCYLEKRSNENRISSPREELIKEMYDYANVEYWMYTLPQFLHHAKSTFKADIPEQAIQFISKQNNSNLSKKNFLKVKCGNCGKMHSYHKEDFDLDFDSMGSVDRNMGTENHYEAMESFECTCGNEITATFGVWEYPEGIHNSDEVVIDGGKLIERFNFTIDFFQYDPEDELVTCEECDGNRENTGNYVHNWHKSSIENEFPSNHPDGKYSKVISGSCDWCNTLHIRCPKCHELNSFPDAEADMRKECMGGCRLVFILESDNNFDAMPSNTLKIVDPRLVPCESCGEEFIDVHQTSICQMCEEKYNEN